MMMKREIPSSRDGQTVLIRDGYACCRRLFGSDSATRYPDCSDAMYEFYFEECSSARVRCLAVSVIEARAQVLVKVVSLLCYSDSPAQLSTLAFSFAMNG